MEPPIRSAASAICSPVIVLVPRTIICCSRFEMPALSGVSVRVPIRAMRE
jgi:hypothetical protein